MDTVKDKHSWTLANMAKADYSVTIDSRGKWWAPLQFVQSLIPENENGGYQDLESEGIREMSIKDANLQLEDK